MHIFKTFLFLCLTVSVLADEGRLNREPNDYKYTSLGIDIVQTDETSLGLRLSFELPGPLYIVAERKAEGIDTDNESYERIINGARLGAQIGIGDLLSNISAKGVNLGVNNIFDVYGELGIKSTSIEGDTNSFSEDDAQAHLIAGVRFGDSNNWEGKIFIDYSKESEVITKPCLDEVCILAETQVIEYVLAEETDQKFGAGVLYNINNRSAVTLEMVSSKVFNKTFKIGYQINF